MDQKDWYMLKTIFEEKNMTRSAEKLYVSQPSLSYRLKNLESEFGVTLFYKTKSGLEFTTEGEHLVSYAKDMLEALQRTKDELQNLQSNVQGTLRIGVSSNFAQYVLPEMLHRFSELYPNVQFHVQSGLSNEVYAMLQQSQVHVAIVRNDYTWHGEKYLLREEQLQVISKEKIDIGSLDERRLINYETDRSLKETINEWWIDQFKNPPTVEMEVDRLETCKEMVKKNFGFAIVPDICLLESDQLYKQGIYRKTGEPVTRNTYLMYHPQTQNLSIVHRFIEYLKNNQM
ncbi:LysR family transcriptional regulator [Bacillaceae bacterium JMAK1]|nr:LysR family transcriptional regulator [Bacillaceae bacterium JMAK1]